MIGSQRAIGLLSAIGALVFSAVNARIIEHERAIAVDRDSIPIPPDSFIFDLGGRWN
ncbi:MAG: hypothetical protein H6954_07975 [Chromatiaceae bacterium]|nr:hypothetical protein [Chromatiaceae bacterium]